MLNGVGIRGSIGTTAQQLLNQLPSLEGAAVRSTRYGQTSYSEFDRSKVNHGYGESFREGLLQKIHLYNFSFRLFGPSTFDPIDLWTASWSYR